MNTDLFKTTHIVHDVKNLQVTNITGNSKDKIQQPDFCDKKLVPRLNTSTLIVGRSGSGKSVLLCNLLKNCYQEAFHLKVLISPTGLTDDVQKSMNPDVIVTDLKEGVEFLEGLMKTQEKYIIEKGSHGAPMVCLILDDVMGENKFLSHSVFVACFTRSRHYNLTVFFLSQKYSGLPKKCRLQVNNVLHFKSQSSENKWISDDFCPSNMTNKKFIELIEWATYEPHSFLYINNSAPEDERYRRNFDEIIIL